MPTLDCPAAWRPLRAPDALRDDLLAGVVVVSVLLIPQSLAYALLAGLPPQAGLYASLLPLLAYAALRLEPGARRRAGGGAGADDLAGARRGAARHGPFAAALVLAAEVGLLLAAAAMLAARRARGAARACRCCTASRPARRCRLP